MTFVVRLIGRLNRSDHGLYDRWALREDSAIAARAAWVTVTHAGGAVATILAAAWPLLRSSVGWHRDWLPAAALAVSHVVVQCIKRTVGRPRPDRPVGIDHPDRFSFPSGHATAGLAVTLAFATAFPAAAVPLVAFGMLVGWSRVALGVHYPGDVVAGQLIAAMTVLGLIRLA